MYEQDYIMRLIKEMIRMLLKLLFNIDTDSPAKELLEAEVDKETLEKLLDLADNGYINQAENEVYELLSNGNMSDLKIVLLFYSYLNDKDDDFLERNNFSREEIQLGIKTIASKYGLNSIAEMFLADI